MERSAANHSSVTWHQDNIQTKEFQGSNYTLFFLLNSNLNYQQQKTTLEVSKEKEQSYWCNNSPPTKNKQTKKITFWNKKAARLCLSQVSEPWHHKALRIEVSPLYWSCVVFLLGLRLFERSHRNKNCDQVAHTGRRHQQLTRSSLVSKSLKSSVLTVRAFAVFFPASRLLGIRRVLGSLHRSLLHALCERLREVVLPQ